MIGKKAIQADILPVTGHPEELAELSVEIGKLIHYSRSIGMDDVADLLFLSLRLLDTRMHGTMN